MDNNRFNQTTGSIGSRFLGSDPTQRLNWTVGFLGMWKRHRAELGAFTFTSCSCRFHRFPGGSPCSSRSSSESWRSHRARFKRISEVLPQKHSWFLQFLEEQNSSQTSPIQDHKRWAGPGEDACSVLARNFIWERNNMDKNMRDYLSTTEPLKGHLN